MGANNPIILSENLKASIKTLTQYLCLRTCRHAKWGVQAIQVELITDRQTICLSEASQLVQQLAPGGTHDVNLAVDVKEARHALVCRCWFLPELTCVTVPSNANIRYYRLP